MKRKDTWRWTLTIDGVDLGVARAVEGGGVESEDSKQRPGGMAPEVSLGGSKTRNNSTVRFVYSSTRHELTPWLEERAGKGVAVLSGTPLDGDKNPAGRVRTLTGTLKDVTPPDYDADSNDGGELELVVVHDEVAT